MREQHDDHIWLTVGGEGWAIQCIEDQVIYLWRGYEPYLVFKVLDMSNFDYESYCNRAVEMLGKGDVDGQDKGNSVTG